MKNVLYILLGWLLGLVSPWVTEIIQRPYRRSQIKLGMFVELRDLRAKLTAVALQVGMNRGTLNADMLAWVRRIVEADRELFKMLRDVPWAIVSQYKDEDLKAWSHATTPTNEKLNFRRYSLPFLDANLTALNLFSVEFQRLAHKIRGTLSTLNEEIDTSWFYFQKTFESLSDINRAIIQRNHELSHDFIGKTSRQIVEDIGSILEL